MNWYVSLSRIEKVQQQPKEAYVNVGEVNGGESIAEVAGGVFQDGSVSRRAVRVSGQLRPIAVT